MILRGFTFTFIVRIIVQFLYQDGTARAVQKLKKWVCDRPKTLGRVSRSREGRRRGSVIKDTYRTTESPDTASIRLCNGRFFLIPSTQHKLQVCELTCVWWEGKTRWGRPRYRRHRQVGSRWRHTRDQGGSSVYECASSGCPTVGMCGRSRRNTLR
jgi:hypothetical protein